MSDKEGKKSEIEEVKDFAVEDTEVKTKSYIASSLSLVRQKVVIVLMLLVAALVIYFIFKEDSETPKSVVTKTESLSKEDLAELSAKSRPVTKDSGLEEIQMPQKLPELPKLAEPILPPAIVTPPVQIRQPPVPVFQPDPGVPIEGPKKSFTTKVNIATPMLVVSGGGVSATSPNDRNVAQDLSSFTSQDLLDPKKFEEFKKSLQSVNNTHTSVSEDMEMQRTSSQVMATYRGNLDYVVGQGKTIDVILENGINTELQGTLRGLVSRDTYSESGNLILIPKGSRLIGTYNTNISTAQSRVDVQWSVIKLPNGIDIQVNSLGTDQLGRGGVLGDVDPRFQNLLLSSILVSSIQVGAGQLAQKILGNNAITTTTTPASTTNPNSSTTTTGNAAAIATSQALTDLSQSLTNFIKKYTDVSPVIKVRQGERMKVFVQQDLVFPKSAFAPTTIQ